MEALLIKGSGRPVALQEVEDLPSEGFVWLDFVREESPDWPKAVERVHGVTILASHVIDSFNTGHPSFFDSTDEYDMIILRGLASSGEAISFESRPTAFFVLDRALITIRPADSVSVQGVKERFHDKTTRIPRRPAGLLHLILNQMVDRFMELREPLRGQLEGWQEALLDPRNPFNDWMALMAQKTWLRRLETLCDQQQDAVTDWKEGTRVEFDASLTVRFNDLLEHIRRVLATSQHLQADLESLVQINFSAAAHRANEIMRVLTVIAAIFLPLTLVAGIFGMNFDYMPELKLRYAYFVVLFLMVSGGVGLFVIFKKRNWI